jgi:NTE family protein
VFVASNLTSGAVWRFSKRTSGDWRTGTVRSPTTDVATVVAASAALLPLLSPATLRLRPEDLHDMFPSAAAVRGNVELTDGGIYDNLAVETAWRTSGTVLASDGRGAAVMGGGGHRLTSQIAQATAGLSRQSLTLRRRQLVSGFQTGIRRGAYWNIGASIDRYAERALDLAVPPAAAASLSRLPTRYAATSSVTQERLINLGYALCDAALRTHVDHDLAAPEGLPYPTAGI